MDEAAVTEADNGNVARTEAVNARYTQGSGIEALKIQTRSPANSALRNFEAIASESEVPGPIKY